MNAEHTETVDSYEYNETYVLYFTSVTHCLTHKYCYIIIMFFSPLTPPEVSILYTALIMLAIIS